jgi:hypothetical protein
MKYLILMAWFLNNGTVSPQIYPTPDTPLYFDSLEACQSFLAGWSSSHKVELQGGRLVAVKEANNGVGYYSCSRINLNFH